MGYIRLYTAISALTTAAYAVSIPRSISCSTLLDTVVSDGIELLTAVDVEAGALSVASYSGGTILNSFPLCHLTGSISYGTDGLTTELNGPNTLTWEMYLPTAENYNGRFMVVGDSGYAGSVDTTTMMTEFNLGYAIAGTDGGHDLAASGNTTYASFLENVAQLKAWIHNSIAIATPTVRDLATLYYAASPDYSYYYGCSTGGAQGYALASLYPDLFDGIYAGSPGNWYSHLVLSFLWNAIKTQGSGYMSQDVLNFITENVLDACDALDGVQDNLIENPLACDFDITSLKCKCGQNSTSNGTVVCLTADQVTAAQAVYAGPTNTETGEEIYPGFALGSEIAWLLQETTLSEEFTALILEEVVFNNSDYNISSFNFGSDVSLVDSIASPLIDAISPSLSSFEARGGKLITTQGWADAYNSPLWPIQFLEQIKAATPLTDDDKEFIQLYMVPGGGHCGPTSVYAHVPGTYDVLDALVPWVENGTVPTQMYSSGTEDATNATRKLCPYPQTAQYVSGSIDDWTSYTCA
ncbi:putative feruloyl esterase B precursor [Xylariales sp. PMI_506]|nr:putative feruloyl esterase B precursor [Xylariales sp. PMI_506]